VIEAGVSESMVLVNVHVVSRMPMACEVPAVMSERVPMMAMRVSVVTSMAGVSAMVATVATSVMSAMVTPVMSPAVTAASRRRGRSDNNQIGAGKQRHQ
jgi:hypothetical protein